MVHLVHNLKDGMQILIEAVYGVSGGPWGGGWPNIEGTEGMEGEG